MDKIKKFFQNRIVMIVEGILILASSAGLTIAGVSNAGVIKYAEVGIAAVGAIDAIITMIAALFGKEKK